MYLDPVDERARLAYDTFNAKHRGIRKGPPWDLLPSYSQDTWREVVRALEAPVLGTVRVRDCRCADCAPMRRSA